MARHTFTRQELYDLIWAEPMSKLAQRYGISDRGLAKACAKANIPVPKRGYWAKAQAGQKLKRPTLPPNADGGDKVVIDPPAPSPPPPAPPPTPESVRVKIDAELQNGNPVTVPKTLSSPHRIVGAWLDDERRQRETYRYDRSSYRPPPKTEVEHRRERILSTLFKELEARKYRLVVDKYRPRQVHVESNGEHIEIQLTEYHRQYRRYYSEEERRKDGHLSSGQRWTQVKEPTGELVLQFKHENGYGWSGTWRDQPEKLLEEQLKEVLAGVAGGFETIRLQREQQMEVQRRREEAERERERKEDDARRESIRVRRLVENAKLSCCRFRGHRDRCFMEPEVGYGATEIYAGV
jgi:hypothetical protein